MAAEAQILTILNILVALHLSRVLYKSTLFMQNKANLLNGQIIVTSVLTKDYENERLRRRWKNKAKTNPIKPNQTQFQTHLHPKNTPNFRYF